MILTGEPTLTEKNLSSATWSTTDLAGTESKFSLWEAGNKRPV
jgi:hypothetical protein